MNNSVEEEPGELSIVSYASGNGNEVIVRSPFFVESKCEAEKINKEGEKEMDCSVHGKAPECQQRFPNTTTCPNISCSTEQERTIACKPVPSSAVRSIMLGIPTAGEEANVEITVKGKGDGDLPSILREIYQIYISPKNSGIFNSAWKVTQVCGKNTMVELTDGNGMVMKNRRVGSLLLTDSSDGKRDTMDLVQPFHATPIDETIRNGFNILNSNVPCPNGNERDNQGTSAAAELSKSGRQTTKFSGKIKSVQKIASPQNQALSKLEQPGEYQKNPKSLNAPKEQHSFKRDQRSAFVKQKLKLNNIENTYTKECIRSSISCSSKDHPDTKVLPNFESFVIEKEEGSGGYGIVYRARRKSDGRKFAIKCPHANANKHHVNNELKMLERFGGKNFVITYEGSFRSEDSSCFVLEHVEHDRPEVLKREIDTFQLQWYGYCMFRALASLHKQGVVHRDVKPGNFLFSGKTNKGYLIDFNLAMDLHQKYGTTNKSKGPPDMHPGPVPLPRAKSTVFSRSRNFMSVKGLEGENTEATKSSKLELKSKTLKRKSLGQTMASTDLGSWGTAKSQGPDGSGITSAKDVTSTRTPSGERYREPLPCLGRKELLNLVQEAMQLPNGEAHSGPLSKRKRVAAPPDKADRKLVYLTPMPIFSSGNAASSSSFVNKGNGKPKREGPCVGTKGFRAPEVLFRSPHQGPKIDIWSAGVTLLYLMVGKTPFVGEPEQNIKEIVKLRGSEDLWEVATLHGREAAFPTELYDAQFSPSKKLRDWCKGITRRPDFFEEIPSSLFDLVDKCLTVNPRVRISAEDALRHEFFSPCHEAIKKQRLLRQGQNVDSGSSHLPQAGIIGDSALKIALC